MLKDDDDWILSYPTNGSHIKHFNDPTIGLDKVLLHFYCFVLFYFIFCCFLIFVCFLLFICWFHY